MLEEYIEIIKDASFSSLKENEISKELDLQFESESDSDDDGELDERLEVIEDEIIGLFVIEKTCNKGKGHDLIASSPVRKRQKKGQNHRNLFWINPNTNQREIFTYENSIWFHSHVLNPRLAGNSWCKIFCQRFRTTHECFLRIVELCRECPLFQRWSEKDGVHSRSKKKNNTYRVTSVMFFKVSWQVWDN